MNLKDRIRFVSDSDVSWSWDTGKPTFMTKTPNSDWGITATFDPFPCYTHKEDLILDIATKVEKLFPIGFEVFYFVFPFETVGRTNGQAQTNSINYADDGRCSKWDGVIELYGKRIPIHPAMTRYLVSHEYGHIVDNWICHCRKLQYNGFDEEYAKMRGLAVNPGYGGRKWHTNTGEIIANDFRICVAGIEKEFWPHDCKHPDDDDNVKNWWYEAMLKYSYLKT